MDNIFNIKNYENAYFLYSSVSFAENVKVAEKIKKLIPDIIIPYIDFSNLSAEIKEAMDCYLISLDSNCEKIIKDINSKIHICVYNVGHINSRQMKKFYDVFSQNIGEYLQKGKLYRIISGDLKNLIVKIEDIDNDNIKVSYTISSDIHYLRECSNNLTQYENTEEVYNLTEVKNFKNLLRDNLAIVIDGDNLLLKAIFNNPDLYTIADNRYVGGAYGFYFQILKIKQMYPEYEVYVTFSDSVPRKKAKYNGNNIITSEKFQDIYMENLKWCKKFCRAVAIPVYQMPDIKSDNLTASIVKHLTDVLKYEKVIIYSQDKDFYTLISKNVEVHTSKESFKQHTSIIDVEEACKEFEVNSPEKILWAKIFSGDLDNDSATEWYNRNNIRVTRIYRQDYLRIINNLSSLIELKNNMYYNLKFRKFIENGYFDINLKNMKLDNTLFDTMPFIRYNLKEFDENLLKECLNEIYLYREFEFFEKNLRILQGVF